MAASHSKNKTALITGILGFTGQYLSQSLKMMGYKVYGTAQNYESLEKGIFKAELSNTRDLSEIANRSNPDVVIHLAAISSVTHSNVRQMYETNIIGTHNLLESLTKLPQRPKFTILASSANVYGNAEQSPIDESSITNPINDYAVSKLAMEKMAKLWMSQLEIALVRPFNYTGVGQSTNFLIPKIVDHFKKGAQKIELGNIEIARDFSDVRFVSECYMRLIETMPSGEIYNICSNRSTSLNEIIKMAADISGHEIKVEVNPAFVRAQDIKDLHGSNEKLIDAVGEIKQIPIEETLRWMIEDNSVAHRN